MSYQVLARKWRPSTFQEMVGQEHVLQALVNALDHNRLHHAYLFTGTRGVGKTSLARLLAKALNCEEGVTSKPCGRCSACQEINEGRFVDLIEVDAASRTKVEDTRELLDNVQYAPSRGRYKIYLIDEVHMLSTHSFNALLKTLEEPPPHIKFLLATTDPHKLPVTILSRCLQFNLKRMTPERIVGHLHYVLDQEQVAYDERSLWLLGRAADGSMRDALSLTDQAIAYGGGSLSESDISAMLGCVDQRQVHRILQQLAQFDAGGVMEAVSDLAEHAPDYGIVFADLLSLLHRMALAQALPDAVDNSDGDREMVVALAQSLRAEDVQLFYQIALNGRKDLPWAASPRDGLEMALLRMLAFRPVMAQEEAVPDASAAPPPLCPSTPDAREAVTESASPQRSEIAAPFPAPKVAQTAKILDACGDNSLGENGGPLAESNQALQSPPPYDDAPPWGMPSAVSSTLDTGLSGDGAAPVPVKKHRIEPSEPLPLAAEVTSVSTQVQVAISEPISSESANSPDETPIALSALDSRGWIVLLEKVGLAGMTYNIAANAALVGVDGRQLNFVLNAGQMNMFNDTHKARIQEAVGRYFGQEVGVVFEVGESDQETPAQFRERCRQERQARAVEAIQKDANVEAMIERFDARLEMSSIRPIDPS